MAALKTDIPGIDRVIGGASRQALPKEWVGKPGTTGGTHLTPANPLSIHHGEHVALENLRARIERGKANGTLRDSDLVGRTVRLRVEQEPCSSCASGLENPRARAGVIKQFSPMYPDLTIEVRSNRTSAAYLVKDGQVTGRRR